MLIQPFLKITVVCNIIRRKLLGVGIQISLIFWEMQRCPWSTRLSLRISYILGEGIESCCHCSLCLNIDIVYSSCIVECFKFKMHLNVTSIIIRIVFSKDDCFQITIPTRTTESVCFNGLNIARNCDSLNSCICKSKFRNHSYISCLRPNDFLQIGKFKEAPRWSTRKISILQIYLCDSTLSCFTI